MENNLVFCQTDLEKLGYSINSRSLKKTYIVIFSDKNRISIEKLITIIHEIGHALYNKTLNSKKMHSTHNDFVETIPYFLEQVFIGYCTKNKIHAIDCLKAQKNDIIGLYNYLIDLKITNRFITKVNIRNLSLKLSLNDLTKIKDYDFSNDTLTLKDCDKNYEYSYGLLLAFYYLNSYNQDPEKTKESIKQFMLNIGIYNDQYILNHFGIVYDDLLGCEFLKPIIIENQKQLSKKPHN